MKVQQEIVLPFTAGCAGISKGQWSKTDLSVKGKGEREGMEQW